MGRDHNTANDQQPRAVVCAFPKQFRPEYHRVHNHHSNRYGTADT